MALAEDVARLSRVPLLGVMESDALRLLAFACETRVVHDGATLFRHGTAGDAGYLVLSGTVQLTDVQGRQASAGSGTLLAEGALLREMTHEHDATAVETTTIFKVPRAAVLRVLEEHPATAQRVLAFYARRLHGALTETDRVKG